jgi:transposase
MPQIVSHVVGIDVSKAKLDWCIRDVTSGSVANAAQGHTTLAAELVRHGVEIAVMEASGGYERPVAQALREAGLAVSVVEPKRVRDFAKAAGRRAKNDPIDADTIAWFGEIFAKQDTAPDVDREELAALVAARKHYVDLRVACLCRREHERSPLDAKLREQLLANLERCIVKFDKAIATKIAKTEHWAATAAILDSVPGVGLQATAAILAWLPELGHTGIAQIAALVGVAPFDDKSGKHDGVRHIAGGRRDLRNILYMATVAAATKHNQVLKAYYRRLRAKGKSAKVAFIACLHKLLHILNVMLARGQTWNPTPHAMAA